MSYSSKRHSILRRKLAALRASCRRARPSWDIYGHRSLTIERRLGYSTQITREMKFEGSTQIVDAEAFGYGGAFCSEFRCGYSMPEALAAS